MATKITYTTSLSMASRLEFKIIVWVGIRKHFWSVTQENKQFCMAYACLGCRTMVCFLFEFKGGGMECPGILSGVVPKPYPA